MCSGAGEEELGAGGWPRAGGPVAWVSAREFASAMAGTPAPSRAAVSSAGRAMTRLAEDGLVVLVAPRYRRRGANTFARRANGS